MQVVSLSYSILGLTPYIATLPARRLRSEAERMIQGENVHQPQHVGSSTDMVNVHHKAGTIIFSPSSFKWSYMYKITQYNIYGRIAWRLCSVFGKIALILHDWTTHVEFEIVNISSQTKQAPQQKLCWIWNIESLIAGKRCSSHVFNIRAIESHVQS